MTKPSKLPEWDTTQVNLTEADASHKSQGWLKPAGVPEKPPMEYDNWWKNLTYLWLEYFNASGLPLYDATTNYTVPACVIGSDGLLYRALIANGPSTTIVNPVGDITGTWVELITLSKGHIDGLITSNNTTDAAHDIDVATGKCRSIDDTTDIKLSSLITKQIDAAWAAGTNAGGLASGVSLTANTKYFVFILGFEGGTADVGFDTSSTAVNLLADAAVIAAGYNKYRRIGSVLTDGSSNILAYHQYGDYFYFDTPILDYSNPALTTTFVTITLSTPLAECTAILTGRGGTVGQTVYIKPTICTGNPTIVTFGNSTEGGQALIVTNSSSQVDVATNVGGGANCDIETQGWIDFRGRQ